MKQGYNAIVTYYSLVFIVISGYNKIRSDYSQEVGYDIYKKGSGRKDYIAVR